MTAPESVVAAVQEALRCEERGGKHRYCYWHGGAEGLWTERGCSVAVRAADAAWAAAYPEALRGAADKLEQTSLLYAHPHVEQILRRWADESEASRG